ncbi:hypothetical protein Tco_1058273 [Tanacetum coccineum]|uniref:Reverse transcriptase domain-containing protein n=1 Tax=Tanacetum coccineum TaxID=301880 RepID=A0ABQ5H7Q4_9ASTR
MRCLNSSKSITVDTVPGDKLVSWMFKATKRTAMSSAEARTAEFMDRGVKSLKRSKIVLAQFRWDSKRGPEFTWERKDRMRSKCPQLFVDSANASSN